VLLFNADVLSSLCHFTYIVFHISLSTHAAV
jgi:hypothetical protein